MSDIDQFTLLPLARKVSVATYVDVNPLPNPGSSELLIDVAAIMASIRNLIKSVRGTRGRIFEPDYFCGIYDLLQEPFDAITAVKMSIALYQALSKWEPRVAWTPSDVTVVPNNIQVGYDITLRILLNQQTYNHTFFLSR